MTQIIPMTQDEDGIWKYHDDTQAEICFVVMVLTGWEITGFDDWINTDSHWEDADGQGEKNRNELIKLRHRLTKTFHEYRRDNYVIQLEAERLFAVAQWISSHITGYKIARKDLDRANSARSSSRLPRPNAVNPLREEILKIMRSQKTVCENFKTFMATWALGHINGLTIKTIDKTENYIVTDEDGDLGETTYTWGSLKTMYSQAK